MSAAAARRKAADVAVEETVEETVSLPRINAEGHVDGWEDIPLSQIPRDENGMVHLLARYASLQMPIIPDVWRTDPRSYREVLVTKGFTLKFQRHRASVPVDMLPLVAQHPAFSGTTEAVIVFLEDDPRAAGITPAGVRVVNGAQSLDSGHRQDLVNQPLMGWDKMPVGDIVKAIAAGRVHDPIGAMAYECRPNGGLRRERVRRALWDASVGETDGGGGDLEVGAVVEEFTGDKVSDTADATVPQEARRV